MNADGGGPLYDVAIVGAGPTGLTLANLLGREGLSVLLVERNATTVQEPRAVSIDDESLRTMQAAGVIDRVLEQVVPGYGSRYLTPGGACFLTVLPTGRPYGYPRRNAFRQPVLEQQLRDGLARFPYVETRFGAGLAGFTQDADGVDLMLEADGGTRRVRARYLVGCDGASSPIRKALGLFLEGETLPERWLIVDLADSPAERDTVVFCDVRRPCIALPGPDLTRRFEFKLFPHEEDAAVLDPANVQRLLRSRGAAPGGRIVRQTVYTFHARLASRWSVGRVFLAGDAAHLTPPFAGQGMNSGIRDAHNLAWKLAAVVRGRLAPSLLDSYEAERRGHVAGMIDLALRMGRIMGPPSRWRGWVTQTAFRVAGLWPSMRSWFGEMKYKPKPSFGEGFLVPSDNPLVGRLTPQPVARTPDGSELLLDDAAGPGFVLLGVDVPTGAVEKAMALLDFGATPVTPLTLATTAAAPRDEAALAVVGAVEPALAAAGGTILLLRPDRYVMAAFSPADVAADAAAITSLFARGDQPFADGAMESALRTASLAEPPGDSCVVAQPSNPASAVATMVQNARPDRDCIGVQHWSR